MHAQEFPHPIAAVVAAAGRSVRMGQPKQLLPWGSSTVLATVLQNLDRAGVHTIACVIGHLANEVGASVPAGSAELVINPHFIDGEMLSSYQAGIRHLLESPLHSSSGTSLLGTLLALGDQPHIPVTVIEQVLEQARRTPGSVVIPSYSMRRGHPIFLPTALWPELLALPRGETLRAILVRHEELIRYVNVDSEAILRDMDTPDDYAALINSGV